MAGIIGSDDAGARAIV
jgi:uncharacterized protein YjiS (DUF1127 family)